MNLKQDGLVLLGGVIGGVLGYAIFFLIVKQGFYGLILPGGLLGIGAGVFKTKSHYVAVVCGLLALAIGLFTEWRFAPFVKDNSLGYFLSHVTQLRPITQVMIAVGALAGFWIPFRRSQDARRAGETMAPAEKS